MEDKEHLCEVFTSTDIEHDEIEKDNYSGGINSSLLSDATSSDREETPQRYKTFLKRCEVTAAYTALVQLRKANEVCEELHNEKMNTFENVFFHGLSREDFYALKEAEMKGFEKFKHDSNQDIEKKETEMKSLLDQLKELENEKKNM